MESNIKESSCPRDRNIKALCQIEKSELKKGLKIENYVLLEIIFKGFSSQVWKGIDMQNQRFVVVKIINKTKFTLHISEHQIKVKKLKLLKTEMRILMNHNCLNLVKYYDIYETQSLIIVAMQYCNEGTLDDYLKQKDTLSQKQALEILTQMIESIMGVDKLNLGILPIDFTPKNIFINNGIHKLANLGLSSHCQFYKKQKFYTRLGVPTTLSPQFYDEKNFIQKLFLKNTSSVIWSLGVLYFLMICSQIKQEQEYYPIFYEYRHLKLLQYVANKNFDILLKNKWKLSLESSKFLRQSLQIIVQKRLTWEYFIKNFQLKKYYLCQIIPKNKSVIFKLNQQPFPNQFKILHSNLTDDALNKKEEEVLSKENKRKITQDQDILELQICKWIANNIIRKMNLPQCFVKQKQQNRRYYDLSFLINSRVFVFLDEIRKHMKHYQRLQNWYLKENIEQEYQKVVNINKKIEQKLTKEQNKIGFKFVEFFHLSSRPEQANLFLTGYVGNGPDKLKQISITSSYYIKWLMDQCPYPNKQQKQVLLNLQQYQKINSINVKELKNKTFDEIIQEILQQSKMKKGIKPQGKKPKK